MRIMLAVAVTLYSSLQVWSGELTEQHKQVVLQYLQCGEIWATLYGKKLRAEPAADIAVASAQKCTDERERVVQIVRDTIDYQDDWDTTLRMLDEKFRALAVSSVMDARMDN